MKKVIRKILKEDRRQMYLDKIIQVINNDYPLFKNMELYGFKEQLSEEELNYVLSGIFGEPVTLDGQNIYNQNGNQIYWEQSNGTWGKKEYDENGNKIYYENSYGYWEKKEYDENGNIIYHEDSYGYWEKKEYDENGNIIYRETSNGYWIKKEYNDIGRLIYRENSNGEIYDRR
jgi:hypothetical protein